MPKRKQHIRPPDKPITREISPVYNDIYGPVTEREHRLRMERLRRKNMSKAEKEMRTTLNGLYRTRTAEALARDKELHNKQQAEWAKNNSEKVAAYQKNWRAKQDPKVLRQYANDSYAADPAPKKARASAYYWKNRNTINARRRAKKAR